MKGTVLHFNTSHVTFYLVKPKYLAIAFDNFNTSHVTVYQIKNRVFKPGETDFNTSHVTVYLHSNVSSFVSIPNFNTSHVTVYRGFLCLHASVFQYISCYGLSPYALIISSSGAHFNTSHVTVYRVVSGAIPGYKDISIHLMLRFIWLNNPLVLAM